MVGMREEGVGISEEIEKLWCLAGVIFERKGKLEENILHFLIS